MTTNLHPDIERVLVDADSIQQRVRELAAEIDRDYADKPRLLLVGVLKGAFIFLSDLCRALQAPHAYVQMEVDVSRRAWQVDYASAARAAQRRTIDGVEVPYLDVPHLILSKQTYREKAAADRVQLERLLPPPA